MTPWALLFLLGVDGSVHMGEHPPGILTTLTVATRSVEAEGYGSTLDKNGPPRGGWRAGGTVHAKLGHGILAGVEVRHRKARAYTKDTLWLSGGWETRMQRLLVRGTVAGTLPREVGVEWRARGPVSGRWIASFTQGAMVYWQPDARVGYYVTASVGVRLH
jgi:hypothetical protein